MLFTDYDTKKNLSEVEQNFIHNRMMLTQPSLSLFVKRQQLKEIDLTNYFNLSSGPSEIQLPNGTWTNNDPTNPSIGIYRNSSAVSVGIAISGGGYRAMLVGAGILKALDSRTESFSTMKGLLDGATHLSALSGGGWLLSTLYHNDFKSIQQLLKDKKVWNLENNILFPNIKNDDSNTRENIRNMFEYYSQISNQLQSKRNAGFTLSVTDLYGRLLSSVLFQHNTGKAELAGISTQWSDIGKYDYFLKHESPYPILMSVARKSNGEAELANNTAIEITPHEIGSFDATLHAFANLKYMGTSVENNIIKVNGNGNKCLSGLDNVGFVAGTTSSIFDRVIQVAIKSDNVFARIIGSLISGIIDPANLDVAEYSPNPFYKYQNPSYSPTSDFITAEKTLHLVDGALAGENVPLWPLIYKPRNLDLILAADMSSNSKLQWPTGNSLINTYARATGRIVDTEEGQTSHSKNKTSKHFMPKVPDENSFVNLGFTTRPVFFGCYASDYLTDQQIYDRDLSTAPPLVIYLANAPISYDSNTSHFKLQYSTDEMEKMIQNGFDLATQSNDQIWSKCVACATIQRENERQGRWDPTDECQMCFDKYCWDGKTLDPRDYEEVGIHNNPKIGKL